MSREAACAVVVCVCSLGLFVQLSAALVPDASCSLVHLPAAVVECVVLLLLMLPGAEKQAPVLQVAAAAAAAAAWLCADAACPLVCSAAVLVR